ncbi:UNVERIFIED_CONTAM: hypothetical protein H355_013733 [Colinus virginianus]|nr:hypothetical protein H355_013733 [Colinus virginianus]
MRLSWARALPLRRWGGRGAPESTPRDEEQGGPAAFAAALAELERTPGRRLGRLELVAAALAAMPALGVARQRDAYNRLLRLLPRGPWLPRGPLHRLFAPFPRQQECGLQVLEQMERYGVVPDAETRFLLLAVFGPRSRPVRKCQRMLYWLPRMRHVNPYPLPDQLPPPGLAAACLGLRRIANDPDARLSVYQEPEQEDSEGSVQPYIVGIQSAEQQELLARHGPERPVFVEGPFPLWLRSTRLFYYVLRGDPLPPHLRDPPPDPERSLYYPLYLDLDLERGPWDDDEFDVDEVEEGPVFALCMAGAGDQRTLAKKPWEQIPKKPKRKKRRRRNVNCLRHAVIWYEDHRQRCPYEPRLAELDPSVGLYTTAVWQCERGHRYFQDLHSPLRPLSDSDGDSDTGPGPPVEGRVAALEAVVCVPLPLPLRLGPGRGSLTEEGTSTLLQEGAPALLQAPPLLILAGPGYEGVEGLQLDVRGNEVSCALLEGEGAFPLEPHLPKTEEDKALGLKQEEVPPPAAAEHYLEPPLEPPREPSPPLPAEDADGSDISAIIYEIPKEPEKRRRSRRGRAPDPEGLPEPILCPYAGCGQVYVALSSFQNHINLVHRKGRTQQCPQPGCGKKFYLTNHLRRHMVIHSGVREFICESCGKSFKRKNHLEVHRRTHTGETPLQ